MSTTSPNIVRVGGLHDIARFREHLDKLNIELPCDDEVVTGDESPLLKPLVHESIRIGNRIAVHPMEGWDGTSEGNPTRATLRRWQRFGESGAKLIWGGEAVAVRHDGRANPNQLLIAEHTKAGLSRLRRTLIEHHRKTTGSAEGLVIGLQLTHSGRYSCPNEHGRREARILYRHPILDRRLGLSSRYPVLTDGEIEGIITDFHRAGHIARELGFDFVDIKHCHGYLGHEFLSAHTRPGKYGGALENRTRFLRDVVAGIRSAAPGLKIAVRLSAFDIAPFMPDPLTADENHAGVGIPEDMARYTPYRWGFGVNPLKPLEADLNEPAKFLKLLEQLEIFLVNISAGSPYYNPHLQRPALYPPSDGYLPPADPLVEVARQLDVTRRLKHRFPKLIFVGTGYTYLQEFLPNVAQAAVREGWTDLVGLGRMVLPYPEILLDATKGKPLERKRICRTFSDCTTAPRNGLPSGCYPLDDYYKNSHLSAQLKELKEGKEYKAQAARTGPALRDYEAQRRPGRKPQGIAAALLPYGADGRIAVESFQAHLAFTHRAGLTNAVNMDTGYVNLLDDEEMRLVLDWTRQAVGPNTPFIAGAYIEGREGDIVKLYRKQMDAIAERGGTPIIFQTKRLHGKESGEKLAVYRSICSGYKQVIAFELGRMFGPNGEIFDETTIRGLMEIPELIGIKHSSLDRTQELARLRLRDVERPDFKIYTGNDLGISMIEYGSDYLLGLATFAPEKFAERDRLWSEGETGYYEFSDALQHLGNIAFRDPVPAYKHSAAVFLHLIGRIPSSEPHPKSPRRPEWEAEILADCARRLGYEVNTAKLHATSER
ncbi:MAG TPA: DUF993 family protein [Terriglobales bacterium]|nr:DUF993 family protein [Terriglobales bacterium]